MPALTALGLSNFALEERIAEDQVWKRLLLESVGSLLERSLAVSGFVSMEAEPVVQTDAITHRFREGERIRLVPESNESQQFGRLLKAGAEAVVEGVLCDGSLVLRGRPRVTGRVWVLPTGPLLEFYRWQQEICRDLADDPDFSALLLKKPATPAVFEPGPDEPDWDTVAPRLVHPVNVIRGPPGCGKTVLTAELLRLSIERSERAAIVTFTNRACDEVLTTLARRHPSLAVRLRRLGNRGGWERDLRGLGVQEAASADVSQGEVLGTSLYKLNEAVDGEARPKFDVLFVDEASQVTLSMLAAAYVSSERLVLVGDSQQLGPLVHSAPTDFPDGEANPAFEHFSSRLNEVIFLPRTRRMLPALCRPVSEAFYSGRLHSAVDPSVWPRNEAGIRLVLCPRSVTGSPISSPPEADEVARLIRDYEVRHGAALDRAERDTGHQQRRYLISCFYRAQVAQVRRALGDLIEIVHVDTVERNQGQTCMIGFLSPGDDGSEEGVRDTSWRLDHRRLNVALTRARLCSVVVTCRPFVELALACSDPPAAGLWKELEKQQFECGADLGTRLD